MFSNHRVTNVVSKHVVSNYEVKFCSIRNLFVPPSRNERSDLQDLVREPNKLTDFSGKKKFWLNEMSCKEQ